MFAVGMGCRVGWERESGGLKWGGRRSCGGQLHRCRPRNWLINLPPAAALAGESTAGMLQSSSYTVSGDPSPLSRGDARAAGAAHSAHSSPLRAGMGGLLDAGDLAAVQSSLANMGLQVCVCVCMRGRRGMAARWRDPQFPPGVPGEGPGRCRMR